MPSNFLLFHPSQTSSLYRLSSSNRKLLPTAALFEKRVLSGQKLNEDNQGILANALHILIVENNQVNQLITYKYLEKGGHQFSIAGDGEIAIAKLREQVFDLILMDIQMPKMDGYQAMKYIRNQMQHIKTPIISLNCPCCQRRSRKMF
jgi:PleD family two-component response regulator